MVHRSMPRRTSRKWKRRIAKISPTDALRLRDYFNDNAAKLNRLQPFLQKPFNSWLDLIDRRLLSALPAVRPVGFARHGSQALF